MDKLRDWISSVSIAWGPKLHMTPCCVYVFPILLIKCQKQINFVNQKVNAAIMSMERIYLNFHHLPFSNSIPLPRCIFDTVEERMRLWEGKWSDSKGAHLHSLSHPFEIFSSEDKHLLLCQKVCGRWNRC